MFKLIIVIVLSIILFLILSKNIEQFNDKKNNDFFKDKIVLITGSTKGIGLSIAKKISKTGAIIIVNGRDEKRLESTVKMLEENNKNKVSGIQADISVEENIVKMFEDIIKKYGRIDILINNAIGRYGKKKLSDKKISDWKKELDTNVNGVFHISQMVINHMKKKELPCKIINISSPLAKHRDTTASSGSIALEKNMIERMSDILAHENFEKNISVSVIGIDSGNYKSKRVDTKNMEKGIVKSTYESLNKVNDMFYDNPDSITSMFIDILKLPHHQLTGKIYSTSSYGDNKKLSKIVPAYQLMLNKNLFKKYKFTKKKANPDDIHITKQNPYGASKNIKKFLKNYDLSKSMFNVNTDNDTILTTKLAKELGVNKNEIVLFKTEFDAIKKIFSLFVPKYSNIFSMYPSSEYIELLSNEMKFGIKYTIFTVNDKKIQPKFKHILSYITPKTKLVYLSSPNVITGQSIISKEFTEFLDKLNDNIVVVIDQTYLDFVIKKQKFDPFKYLKKNVIVIRSFSNFYGFENLEMSYLIANKDISLLLNESNIIQNQTDRLSEEIALQCLKDKTHSKFIKNEIHKEKQRLYKIFDREDIDYFPSEANYILIDPKKNREEISKELISNNIIIEESDLHYNNYWPLPISTKENNDKIIDILISSF